MTTDAETPPPRARDLPTWSTLLAVVAHPDDESFGLGAVLDAFTGAGAAVSVLCLTRGEASTVHGVAGDLAVLRASELRTAATTLGVREAVLRDYPDGALADVDRRVLEDEVTRMAARSEAQGLLVFDASGVTGHPDHAAATAAALEAAADLDLPVLGWTVPRAVAEQLNEELDVDFVGHEPEDIDLVLVVGRERQRVASLAHVSQAVPTSVLWRRLELLGEVEHLRWLRGGPAEARSGSPAPAGPSRRAR